MSARTSSKALSVIMCMLLTGSVCLAPVQALAQTNTIAVTVSELLSRLSVLLGDLGQKLPSGLVQGAATTTLSNAEMEDRIEYLQKKVAQTDREIASINTELAVVRTQLVEAQTAVYGVPPVIVPVPATNTRATYKGLTGSYVLETGNSLTHAEAVKKCTALIAANPNKNIWCSWDSQVISGKKPSSFVLGASTSRVIEDLEDEIARLERRLAILIPRKAGYETEIAQWQADLTGVPIVTPPPIPVPPVVVPPSPVPQVPPVIVTPPVVGMSTPATCGAKPYVRKITVTDTNSFKVALAGAVPGDYIDVQPGTYRDVFVIENKVATPALPITICGSTGTLLTSVKAYSGYGMYLKNVSSIVLANIAISGYLKGVMLDSANNGLIERIMVSDIGNEGVHFRQNSSNNIIQKSTIFNTGMVEPAYGEGVYIGSANSNWCKYTACNPDKSNWNQVLNNDIYHTAAESVDIKEGTTGGIVVGNRFEGSAMTGDWADSFVDVKGDNYIIKSNSGKIGLNSKGASYQLDAYQHHVVYDGMGNNNLFQSNTVSGAIPGYVVYLMSKGVGNTVMCDNVALTSAKGVTNVGACKP